MTRFNHHLAPDSVAQTQKLERTSLKKEPNQQPRQSQRSASHLYSGHRWRTEAWHCGGVKRTHTDTHRLWLASSLNPISKSRFHQHNSSSSHGFSVQFQLVFSTVFWLSLSLSHSEVDLLMCFESLFCCITQMCLSLRTQMNGQTFSWKIFCKLSKNFVSSVHRIFSHFGNHEDCFCQMREENLFFLVIRNCVLLFQISSTDAIFS